MKMEIEHVLSKSQELSDEINAIQKKAESYKYMPIRQLKRRGWINIDIDSEREMAEWALLQYKISEESINSIQSNHKSVVPLNELMTPTKKIRLQQEMWVNRLLQLLEEVPCVTYQNDLLSDFINKYSQISSPKMDIGDLLRQASEIGVTFRLFPNLNNIHHQGAILWKDGNPVIVYTMEETSKKAFLDFFFASLCFLYKQEHKKQYKLPYYFGKRTYADNRNFQFEKYSSLNKDNRDHRQTNETSSRIAVSDILLVISEKTLEHSSGRFVKGAIAFKSFIPVDYYLEKHKLIITAFATA
jgi:hypothetical protein